MTKALDKVMAGLDDARAYLKGARDGIEVHEVEVPEPDVATIRGKTGLSRPAFAKSIDVPFGTLENWEQGRRRPEGPARVLVALIEKRPSIVLAELARSVVRVVGYAQKGALASVRIPMDNCRCLGAPG